MYHGIINVYKEKGFTSHDVVAKLRGILPVSYTHLDVYKRQNKIQDVRQRLKDGDPKAAPYYGEVKDQSGKVRIADGVDATYDELMNMDYLVDNIDGEITAKE